MTTHYLKIALRNMRKFKLQTIVCLTGLAVGMTCFALGTLWLRFIESFEDFVPDKENVYLASLGNDLTRKKHSPYSAGFFGASLKESYPQVEDWCAMRCYPDNSRNTTKSEVCTEHGKEATLSVAYSDSAFFRFFDIEPLRGSTKDFHHGDLALTESAARLLFPDEEALGKRVTIDVIIANMYSLQLDSAYVVKAIIPDCPQNTQFYYEAIGANPEVDESNELVYDNNDFCTFVRLNAKAETDSLVLTKMTLMRMRNGMPIGFDCMLLPLTKLRTDYPFRNIKIGVEYVRWFMLIGLLVIVCSLVNYLITMTSHLRRRGWEFSLRRVLGSSRFGILLMVSIETLLMLVLSALLASVLTYFVLPTFREYSTIELSFSEVSMRLLAYLALVIVGGMLLTALTAWIVMWRTQRNVLSSRQLSHSSQRLDHCGVILQMALSMAIIFSLVIMLRQVNFLMYSDELGFVHTNIALIYTEDESVRAKIRQSPLLVEKPIEDKGGIMLNSMHNSLYVKLQDSENDFCSVRVTEVDSTIYKTLHLQLVAGRLPVAKFGGEPMPQTLTLANGQVYEIMKQPDREVLVNEKLCHELNVTPENIVGKVLGSMQFSAGLHVCGVLKDIYYNGPTVEPEAYVYYHFDDVDHQNGFFSRNVIVRTQRGRMDELIDSAKAWCEQVETMYVCNNIEKSYEEFLESEQMLIKILMAVGGASLIVCIIGTFSLVSLSLQQRRKDIAIRKVHGAKTRDIMRIFLRCQITSLFIAAITAYPIAFIIMSHWLEGYAKQVSIDWWLIPATFTCIAAVVLTTIALKIWRAAKESTVEALNS